MFEQPPLNNEGNKDSIIEKRKIETLLQKHNEESLDPSVERAEFDLESVGDSGFILRNKNATPESGVDWFLFDLDDTIMATTEAKKNRLEAYKDLIKKDGIHITDEDAEKIVNLTDEFSRWEEKNKPSKNYHPTAHITALGWATQKIKESNDPNFVINEIEETLKRIKEELTLEVDPKEDDPFYFRREDGKLVSRAFFKNSKDIGRIFLDTMVKLNVYEETKDGIQSISQDASIATNVGLFTYGEPYYQLTKILELIKNNPDFIVNEIWLTKVPKGEFISTLLNNFSEKMPAPLEKESHAVVMLDDSPKELQSIDSKKNQIKDESGALFRTVLSRRSGTKEESKLWDNNGTREINFKNSPLAQTDVIKTLQINRYLALRESLGEDNEKVLRVKQLLINMDIDAESIK